MVEASRLSAPKREREQDREKVKQSVTLDGEKVMQEVMRCVSPKASEELRRDAAEEWRRGCGWKRFTVEMPRSAMRDARVAAMHGVMRVLCTGVMPGISRARGGGRLKAIIWSKHPPWGVGRGILPGVMVGSRLSRLFRAAVAAGTRRVCDECDECDECAGTEPARSPASKNSNTISSAVSPTTWNRF
jgi:hypothetical protein